MRVVIQRVKEAKVEVEDKKVASIEEGLLLLVGFSEDDGKGLISSALWNKIISKIPKLRIFPDKEGKFNLSLEEYGGKILVVSQFTLYGDIKKGRRPSFSRAAPPTEAKSLYKKFLSDLRRYFPAVEEGIFGADMKVSLCNWGPVTLIMDSEDMK